MVLPDGLEPPNVWVQARCLCRLGKGARIGAPRRTRTCNMPLLRRPPLPIGLPARTRGRLRTCTVRRLRPGLFRLGYAGELVRSERLELPCLATTASKTVVSAFPPRAHGVAFRFFLAETRAVGRSYGSRGALMLRERQPALFNHSEPKMRSKSASTRAMISRVTSVFAIVVLP